MLHANAPMLRAVALGALKSCAPEERDDAPSGAYESRFVGEGARGQFVRQIAADEADP